MSKKFTRRQFMKVSAIGLAATGAVAAVGRIIAIPPDMHLPDPFPVLPDELSVGSKPATGPIFFDEHQYALVATIASIIVPTDEDPGATEAGVADYIDRLVARVKEMQGRYAQGLRWIDDFSRRRYGSDFLGLKVQEQIGLLHSIDKAEAMRSRPARNVIERVDRKIDTLWDDFSGAGEGIGFLRTVRRDVFYGYYSNPISWKVVGYYGPPQPVGYVDFAEPPSPADYTGAIRAVDDDTCRKCHFTQNEKPSHRKLNECTKCHPSHFNSQEGI